MSFIHMLVLGAVEGFTEFLPISSTAHLILASKLLMLPDSEFLKSYIITVQLGAILAIVVLYWKRLTNDWETNKRLLVAFVPTAVIGLVLYKAIKNVFFDSYSLIVLALFFGGAALIAFEKFHAPEKEVIGDMREISYRKAFLIGCAQSLAVVPGVSRAAATIIGGLLLGVKRRAIVEFSFLLAVPTMAAATGYDLLKNGSAFSVSQFGSLAFGFVISFVFAFFGVRFLLRYVQQRSFVGFGIYRMAVALLLFALILA